MNVAVWVAVAIPIMLGFAPITQAGTTKIDTKQLDKLRGSVRLPLPDELRDRVIGRIRTTERQAVAGAIAGLAVMAVVAVLFGPDEAGGALILLGVGVGGGIGSAVGILSAARKADPSWQRIARSSAVESTDYVAPRTVILARALLGIACVAAVLGLVAVVGGTLSARQGLTFVLLPFVGALVCYAALEILMRLVVERAQRATSELELAWDDVLRAHGLRQAVTSSIVVSAACAVCVALGLISAATDAPLSLIVPASAVGLIGAVAGIVAMIVICTEPAYRVLQQLWPRAAFVVSAEPGLR